MTNDELVTIIRAVIGAAYDTGHGYLAPAPGAEIDFFGVSQPYSVARREKIDVFAGVILDALRESHPAGTAGVADAAAAAARESSRGRLDLWRSYPPEDLEWQLLPHAEWWAESYQKQERVDAFMAAVRLLATAAQQPQEGG